jgi:bacterial/archaeal transporter family-2 protein
MIAPKNKISKLHMYSILGLLPFCFLALIAGSSLVVQSALNASLRSSLESWTWAALISYLGGSVTLLLILLIQRVPFPALATIAMTPRSAWTGGCFGVIYIVLSIVLIPRLGATMVFAFVVLGQMLTSLLFDQYGLMGLTQQPATPLRLTGALVLVAGVVLMRL